MVKFEKIFKKSRNHYLKGHVLRAKLYRVFMKLFYQCDILPSTDISESAYFCHNAFGVVINPNSVIQGGVILQHSVTIGELDTHDAPVIEENVYIGARAIILGNVTIGKNSKIGAGAVVLTDAPPNCTAVGVPARIIKQGESC